MDRGQYCIDVCVVVLAEQGELCVRPDPPPTFLLDWKLVTDNLYSETQTDTRQSPKQIP